MVRSACFPLARTLANLIHRVPTHLVPDLWPALESLCEKAMKWHPFMDAEDVLLALMAHKAALFLAVQERQILGFAVTEVITYPRRKVANVLAAAGHRGFLSVAVHELYIELERWAIEQDADTFSVIGRPGWLKYAKQHEGAQSLSTVTSWKRLGECQVAAAIPTQFRVLSLGRA